MHTTKDYDIHSAVSDVYTTNYLPDTRWVIYASILYHTVIDIACVELEVETKHVNGWPAPTLPKHGLLR